MKIVEKKIVSKEELANYLDEGHFVFDTDNSKHFFSVCFKVPKNQSQGEIAHDEIWTGKLRSLYFSISEIVPSVKVVKTCVCPLVKTPVP